MVHTTFEVIALEREDRGLSYTTTSIVFYISSYVVFSAVVYIFLIHPCAWYMWYLKKNFLKCVNNWNKFTMANTQIPFDKWLKEMNWAFSELQIRNHHTDELIPHHYVVNINFSNIKIPLYMHLLNKLEL